VIITGPPVNAVSGISTHVRLLLESAVCSRFRVAVLCAGSGGLNEGIVRQMLRRVRTPLRFFAMAALWRPSIVHINTSLNPRSFPRDAALLLLAWLTRCPVIWQVHGGAWILDLEQSNRTALAILKLFLMLPRRVVVICQQDELGYGRLVAADRLRRISNAVQVPELLRDEASTTQSTALRITYMGRLVEEKGVLDLLDAMRMIVRDHEGMRITLQFAGAGPIEAQLRLKVQEYRLGDSVQLLGQVSGRRKQDLLTQTHVFVLPSALPERLPYALLEAMAVGIPPIACAVGGVTELIEHRRTGLLIPPHRPDLLAAAILELARDRQLLTQMSKAARERIQDSYQGTEMAARVCALYEEVLGERGPP
jgi:glycosyltransferase involved in cell wall biosynthesis